MERMDKLHCLTTEVEEFLPDYFLPEEEPSSRGISGAFSIITACCLLAVCGITFFVWSPKSGGSKLVVQGSDNTGEGWGIVKESVNIERQMIRRITGQK